MCGLAVDMMFSAASCCQLWICCVAWGPAPPAAVGVQVRAALDPSSPMLMLC